LTLGDIRVAWQAVTIYRALNGCSLSVAAYDAVAVMVAIAAGELDEAAGAEWLSAVRLLLVVAVKPEAGGADGEVMQVEPALTWGRRASDHAEHPPDTTEVRRLLDTCAAQNASDLHVRPGDPPMLRVDGELIRLPEAPLDAKAAAEFCRALCAPGQWGEVEKRGTADLGITHRDDRFRVSVLRQRGGFAAVVRRIAPTLMSFDQIGLDRELVTGLLRSTRGLVLVTGPTGSGKSTTLAAMVNWVNSHQSRHVVTIEDPVEYLHRSKKGIVTQREVGVDVPSFPEAMRRVVRQDPDVIMVGEMRDLETIAAAVTAAETGHLVLATLHTTGNAKTISRIIDVFPPNQQAQIRVQLSMSLLAVISQVLVRTRARDPDADSNTPGRVAGLEVMTMTPAIANMIRHNEENRIDDAIQTSRRHGMFLLDDHLAQLVKRGVVDHAAATAVSRDQDLFDRRSIQT
jgi:twitching motility protein PilT